MKLPLLFEQQMQLLLGDECETFCRALLNDATPVSVRMNVSKCDQKPHLGKPVGWNDCGYYLPLRPHFTFDPVFHAGGYYVQEASSMFLQQVLRQYVHSPVRFLDLCASPGGKSTDAIASLPVGSLVVSNEVLRNRAHVLAENVIKWGSPYCVVTNNEVADFGQLTHYFDVILTDVPCSGEGMFRKDVDAVGEWSPNNVDLCARRQKEILMRVWESLRPGGILIYSTCTYNLDENEKMLHFLASEFGATPLTVAKLPEWGIKDALWGEMPASRFMPHCTHGEGLFVAAVRKPDEEVFPREKLWQAGAKQKKNKKEKKPSVVDALLKTWVHKSENYDFVLRDDDVMAFPKEYAADFELFSTYFRLFHAGIPLATDKGKEWQPHHALALSTALNRETFSSVALSLPESIAYLRRESLVLGGEPARGYALVTYRDLPLGWVKQVGSRANNQYPQEWRIRSGYTPDDLQFVLSE